MTQNLGDLFAGEQKKLSETSRSSKQFLISTIDGKYFPLAGERVRTQDKPDSFLMISSSKIPSPQFTENCPEVTCVQVAFKKFQRPRGIQSLNMCCPFLNEYPRDHTLSHKPLVAWQRASEVVQDIF